MSSFISHLAGGRRAFAFALIALLAVGTVSLAPTPARAQLASDAPVAIQQSVGQDGALEPIRDDWFLNRVVFWLTILHHSDGESQLIDAGSDLEDGADRDPALTVDALRGWI